MTLLQVSTDDNAPVYLVTDFDDSAEVRSEAMTSESSSARSMSTLSSGEVAEYFKTLHGFTYVTDDNVPLAFPTDAVAERVNIVFNIITRLCQGGKNVPGIADELLARGGLDGGGARVLSLVTNSGVWAYEVAGAYPNAEIVSIDVKPLTALVPHERIKFEVYNVYAGIAEPDASFDVVHARQCVTLVKDYNFMIREMYRVLKPGGLLVIGEMPSQSYEVSDPTIPLRTSPMRAEAIALMRRAHTAQGIDLAAWDEMFQRLDPGHPMWENNNPDTKTTTSPPVRGFRNITTFTHLIPNGPWSNEESQRVIGAMAKLIFEKAWKALPPMLRMMGMNEGAANTFLARLEAEVQDPRYRSYAKYKIWCARKI